MYSFSEDLHLFIIGLLNLFSSLYTIFHNLNTSYYLNEQTLSVYTAESFLLINIYLLNDRSRKTTIVNFSNKMAN